MFFRLYPGYVSTGYAHVLNRIYLYYLLRFNDAFSFLAIPGRLPPAEKRIHGYHSCDEELPKGARVTLDGADGSYEYELCPMGSAVELRSRLVLRRTYFSPADYHTLRDFFA